ncbi:MAG: hypothetical protein R2713_18495 [Ilumatobacteraceae bacterium]
MTDTHGGEAWSVEDHQAVARFVVPFNESRPEPTDPAPPRRCSRRRADRLAVAACGLTQSSEFEQISGDDIQFDLDQTTTTGTTDPADDRGRHDRAPRSRSPPPPRSSSNSCRSSSSPATSSTRCPSRSRAPCRRPRCSPPSAKPATGHRDRLRTIPTREGRDITVTKERGTAIIDLPAGIFDVVVGRDQRLFFAQLVLTIGRLRRHRPGAVHPGRRTDQRASGDGSQAETVTVDDYQSLLVGAPASTTTTTVETTTPPADTVTGSSIGG